MIMIRCNHATMQPCNHVSPPTLSLTHTHTHTHTQSSVLNISPQVLNQLRLAGALGMHWHTLPSSESEGSCSLTKLTGITHTHTHTDTHTHTHTRGRERHTHLASHTAGSLYLPGPSAVVLFCYLFFLCVCVCVCVCVCCLFSSPSLSLPGSSRVTAVPSRTASSTQPPVERILCECSRSLILLSA